MSTQKKRHCFLKRMKKQFKGRLYPSVWILYCRNLHLSIHLKLLLSFLMHFLRELFLTSCKTRLPCKRKQNFWPNRGTLFSEEEGQWHIKALPLKRKCVRLSFTPTKRSPKPYVSLKQKLRATAFRPTGGTLNRKKLVAQPKQKKRRRHRWNEKH